MPTYRERREARLERLRQWAEKRKTEASRALNSNPELRHDHAFNTQPGHIPARARMIRADDKAFKSLDKAQSMERRADSIENQLDRSIYDDDPDAIERLTEKAERLEQRRADMKSINKAYRQGDADTLTRYGLDLQQLRNKLEAPGVMSWNRVPYPAWELTNIGATIRTARKRIEDVKRRRQQAAEVEAAGGFKITRHASGFSSVQFAEKPEWNILNDLKSAGFHWGKGSWTGYTDKLPASVLELETPAEKEAQQ